MTPKTLRTDGTSICDLTSALHSTIQGCERVSQEGMREASPDSQRRLHPDTAHPLHVLPFVFGFPLTSNVSLEGQISPALFLSSLFPSVFSFSISIFIGFTKNKGQSGLWALCVSAIWNGVEASWLYFLVYFCAFYLDPRPLMPPLPVPTHLCCSTLYPLSLLLFLCQSNINL